MRFERNTVAYGLLLRLGGFFLLSLSSLILQQGMYIIDSLIVGNILGKEMFAAIETSTVLLRLPVNIAISFSTGITIILSHAIEQHNKALDCRVVSTGLQLSVLVGFSISLIAFISAPKLLAWTKVPDQIFFEALDYFRFYLLGTTFVFLFNICIGIIYAYEDALTPLIMLGVSLVLNVILDLLLVGTFGLSGSAVATAFSQSVVACIAVTVLYRRGLVSKTSIRLEKGNSVFMAQILFTGFPIALQTIVFTITNLFIQRKINILATDSIAQWALCNRMDSLVWLVIDALIITATIFFSHACARKNQVEILRNVLLISIGGASIVALICTIVFSFASPISTLFLNDESITSAAATLVRWLTPFYFLYFIGDLIAAFLRGSKQFLLPLCIIIIHCAVRVLSIYVFQGTVESISDIATGYAISWVVSTVLYVIIGVPCLTYRVKKCGRCNS